MKMYSQFKVTIHAVALAALFAGSNVAVHAQTNTSVSRAVGVVKAISGNQVTLATDSGSEATITIQDSTRMVRTAPGQTSLKDATPMTLQELQVGDRVLARGTLSEDGKSVVASSAIVMKQSDVAAHQQQQREDWQKRGVGGLVKGVDPASGTIQISAASFAGTKNIAIQTTKSTIIRRYSPDSVKFDDAKPGTLDQIKPGDQLRARGARNDDGSQLQAEEIVSGSFRNIAGTVSSVDAGQKTVSVMDLISKRPITIKIGPDSQMKQLPAMFAQRIAMRLKGGGAPQAGTTGPSTSPAKPMPSGSSATPGAEQGHGGGGGSFYAEGNRPGGSGDFQQMLSRLPAAALTDLHKGDAVIIVTTEGSGNSAPTAITLLSGVEPLLTASPDSSRASTLLSPWNLGSSPGGDAAAQ